MSNLVSGVTGAVGGVAIGTAASTALEPVFEPISQDAWANAVANGVTKLLSEGQLAELVASALLSLGDAETEVTRRGFGKVEFNKLVNLALKVPGTPDAEKLYLRSLPGDASGAAPYPGAITLDQLNRVYAKSGIEYPYWKALTDAAANQLLSPAQIALGIVRSLIPDPGFLPGGPYDVNGIVPAYPASTIDPIAMAKASGISEDLLRVMVGSIGLPPSVQQLASMTFRSIIQPQDYTRGLQEGDARVEWGPYWLEQARQILTAHDYVELHLRGWIDQPTMYAGTALHGMSQADTDNLFLVLGRPIPVHQITKGLARGAVYDGDTSAIPAEYLKSMQEANTRPEWYALEFAANEYSWPGYFVLKPLTAAGVITVEECTQILEWSGWEPGLSAQVAQSFITTATTASTHVKSAQTQAISVIKKAYVGGAYKAPDAIAALTALDVTGADQPIILKYWDQIATATAAIGAAEAPPVVAPPQGG